MRGEVVLLVLGNEVGSGEEFVVDFQRSFSIRQDEHHLDTTNLNYLPTDKNDFCVTSKGIVIEANAITTKDFDIPALGITVKIYVGVLARDDLVRTQIDSYTFIIVFVRRHTSGDGRNGRLMTSTLRGTAN